MYKIATGDNHVELGTKVSDLMMEGYTPIGGVAVEIVHIEGGPVYASDGKPKTGESSNYATSKFYQAMFKR